MSGWPREWLYSAFLWVPIVVGILIGLVAVWLSLPRQRRRDDLRGETKRMR
jgi:hypothetical protein